MTEIVSRIYRYYKTRKTRKSGVVSRQRRSIDAPKPDAPGVDHPSQPSQEPNRLPLCQRCHVWGHISIHNLDELRNQNNEERFTTTRYSVTLEELTREVQCGICASVLAACQDQPQYIPDVQPLPPAEIKIDIAGPFYLDSSGHGFHSPDPRPPRHGDWSTPNGIVVGMFMQLVVQHWGPPERADDPTTPPPVGFIITPLFKLTYSNDVAKILTAVEGWEVPFFDVTLLGRWLERCEARHAGQCGGTATRKSKFTGWPINRWPLTRC